jgi:hypothetical protein
MDISGYLAFEPVSEGTRVTQHMELHTRGFMALADALVAGSLRRGLAAGLGDVKALLESGVPAGV